MELASPGFSIYLTACWPDCRGFSDILHAIEPCVDYLEIGIPSRNPLYDGPVIRHTHYKVVKQGITLEGAFKLIRDMGPAKPFVFMGYMHEHLRRIESLLASAAEVGALSVLFPDLPFEYPSLIQRYTETIVNVGLKPTFFASSRFPHGMLREYASMNPLFIYLGLQPATGVRLPSRMLENIKLARRIVGEAYLLAGFSIRSGRDAAAIIRAGASGVVVGSGIVKAYLNGGVEEAVKLACSIKEAIGNAR